MHVEMAQDGEVKGSFDENRAQAIHTRTFPLLFTLERLNTRQGLGFIVWSKVIDRKTLNWIAMSVISFAGAVLPVIVALMLDAPGIGDVLGDAQCNLTETQQDVIRSVMGGNSSCNWLNTTLAEVLRSD
eukprot:SAG31_NODE_1342_length_8700_cov_12.667829_3_plen_129_part_00